MTSNLQSLSTKLRGNTSPAAKHIDPKIAKAVDAKLKGRTIKVPYAGKEKPSTAPKADAREQVTNGRSNVATDAPTLNIVAKGTMVDGIDCTGMIDNPKLAGVPVFLQPQNRRGLTDAEKAKVDAIAARIKAEEKAKSATTARPAATAKADKPKTAKADKAAKPAKPRKPSDRAHYDWSGARDKAAKGTIPAAPDFSANTHRSYRGALGEVEKLVKARDLAGLQAYRVKGTSTSPNAIKRYREIAIIALKVKK